MDTCLTTGTTAIACLLEPMYQKFYECKADSHHAVMLTSSLPKVSSLEVRTKKFNMKVNMAV